MSTATGIPKNFAVANVTESTVELTWLPPNEEEENNLSYQVFMRKAGGSLFKKNPETLFVTKDKNYIIKSLDNGTEYEFRIRCGYIGKWGKWSERIVVRTFLPFSWKEYTGEGGAKKYLPSKENPNIVTMTGDYSECTIIGSTPISPSRLSAWNIKVLSSKGNDGQDILIGIAPTNASQDENNAEKCGWYFDCYTSSLFSGPPQNFKGKEYGPRKEDGKYVKNGDVVGIMMNAAKGELSFFVNGVNLGVAFDGIPLDRPLVPCALLKWKDDSVKLDYCLDGPLRKLAMKNELLLGWLTEEQFEEVWTACYKKAEELNERRRLPKDISIDDAAIIAMYTFDFGTGNFERNPCTIINNSIKENGLDNAGVLARLLLVALRKLPRCGDRELHRGTSYKVEASKYMIGKIVTWPTFSSASPDMESIKKYLTNTSKEWKPSGMMFIICGAWGYDIQPYSFRPDDQEIILEPGSRFKVLTTIPGELDITKLYMLEPPFMPGERKK